MGIRDAFRSLRADRSGDDRAGGHEEAAALSDVEEPVLFRPRFDGTYRAHDEIGEPDGFLRFNGGRVFFAPPGTPVDTAANALQPGNSDPWTGEYTPAGRFTVQRRFERPVIHTVLEIGAESFVARRTSTADNRTAVLTYTFVPSVSPSAPPDQDGSG